MIEVNDTLYPVGGGMIDISDPDAITLYYKVSPNPFRNSTRVEFSLKMDADVTLELYDFTGVKVNSILDRRVSAGENISVQLSPNTDMQSGMYLLVLSTQYGVETRSVLLRR